MITWQTIIASIYFFLPAYIANAIPPLLHKANVLNCLAKPMDGGKSIRNNRIFGSHKTWRGAVGILITGIIVTTLLFFINQKYNLGLYEMIGFDYQTWNPILFGTLLSLGVIIGDVLFAFIKRRVRLKPGAPFLPFDQTNYVIGCFIVLQPFIGLPLNIWLIIFILTFFIHATFNRIGYALGLHNAKW